MRHDTIEIYKSQLIYFPQKGLSGKEGMLQNLLERVYSRERTAME
jgi:hypothetical protein